VTYSALVTDALSVPAPLGWCSWCLSDHQEESQAVTLFNGTALCSSCNGRAHRQENEMVQEYTEQIERNQRETEEMENLGRPGL
jgi:hypothetical protein